MMLDSTGIIVHPPVSPPSTWKSQDTFNSDLSIPTLSAKRNSTSLHSNSISKPPAPATCQFGDNQLDRVCPNCCHILRNIDIDRSKSVSVGHLDCLLQPKSPDLPFRWKSVRLELDPTPTSHKSDSGFQQTESFDSAKGQSHTSALEAPTSTDNFAIDDVPFGLRFFSPSMDSDNRNEELARSNSTSNLNSKHVILPGCSNFEKELVREVAHFELCDFLIAQLEHINATFIDSEDNIDLDLLTQYDPPYHKLNGYGEKSAESIISRDDINNLEISPKDGTQFMNHKNSDAQNIGYWFLEQNAIPGASTYGGIMNSEKQLPPFFESPSSSDNSATSLAVNIIRKCQTIHDTSPNLKQLLQELKVLEQSLIQTCDFDWAHRSGSAADSKSTTGSYSNSDMNQSYHGSSLPESVSRTSTVLNFTKSVFERTTSPKKKIDGSSVNSGPSSSGLFSLSTNQVTNSESSASKQIESKSSSTNNDLLLSRSRYMVLPPHYSYLQHPNIVTLSKNLNCMSSLYLGNPVAQSRIQLLANWNQEGINPNFFRSPVHTEQLPSSQSFRPIPKTICASLPYGLLTNPPISKSKRKNILVSQNNRCAGCGIFVETRCLKRMRFCEFFGRFFCCVCHSNTLMTLPGNLLSHWDFRMLPVSNFARDRLNQLHHQPLLRTCDFNRQMIAKQINFLDCLSLRRQGSRMLPFMQFCDDARSLMITLKRLPQHWLGTPEFWSMADLHAVQGGRMALKLREVLHPAVDHLIVCTRCRAQGFICEVCHSGQILFPFGQPNTVSCPSCSACYHRTCLRNPQPETCPRCVRRSLKRKLHEQTGKSMNQSDKSQPIAH